MALYMQAKNSVEVGLEKNIEKRRKMDNVVTVMQFAKEKLEEAILQVPDSYHTLVYLGRTGTTLILILSIQLCAADSHVSPPIEHWLAREGHAHRMAMARSRASSLMPNITRMPVDTVRHRLIVKNVAHIA